MSELQDKKVLCMFCSNRLLPHLALKLYFEKSYSNRWLNAIEQGHTHINHVCEFTLLIDWRGNCIKISKIFIYKKDKGFCWDSLCLTINQSIHWHVQNAVIPCRSQEPLPFLPVIHFFLPLLSADHSTILPHFIQPSISWSTSWSCCFQIHIQYSFGNPIFFHSLYMSKPTWSMQPYCLCYSRFFNICINFFIS